MKNTYERKTPRIAVGSTPKSTYATWDDHRRAIERASEEARAKRVPRPRRAA